ncbi:hypothetical protein [Cohnella lupini]|uniref:hypothetical protein n=1 Tax=Cohnella lupini TaxID=1294267 RepID=UPI0015F28702|nr:hypothetical protein [Cohnella lupini]
MLGNGLLVNLLSELLLAAPELGSPIANAPESVRVAIREMEKHYRDKKALAKAAVTDHWIVSPERTVLF